MTEDERENLKLKRDRGFDNYEKRIGFQHDFAQSALKTLMIMNGGSIIALMAFIGKDGGSFDAVALWWSLFFYGCGLVLTLLALLLAYLSQGALIDHVYVEAERAAKMLEGKDISPGDEALGARGKLLGVRLIYCGIAFFGLGIVTFAIGSILALNGILI